MPRTTKEDVEEIVVKPFRMSISIDPSTRRNIRIAAAIHDMDPGEWAAHVLTRAADKALANIDDPSEEVS